jgi:hypothetical protein
MAPWAHYASSSMTNVSADAYIATEIIPATLTFGMLEEV